MKNNTKKDFTNLWVCMFYVLLFSLIACKDHDTPDTQTPPHWTVTTIAGGGEAGFQDGTGKDAKFDMPIGLALSPTGDIYVADYNNNRIRKVTKDGAVTTLAGTGEAGKDNGPVDKATFYRPRSMVVAKDGTLFVTEGYRQIRKISDGIVSTLAGGSAAVNLDGTGSEAGFNTPTGITIDADGNLFVADQYNNSIRKITQAGVVTTYAGSKVTTSGYKDGLNQDALFFQPIGICSCPDGSLFITDSQNERIRQIKNGYVYTFAGSGSSGYGDGTGLATRFWFPSGIDCTADNNSYSLYIADSFNNVIRKISASGVVVTSAAFGFKDPLDVKVDSDGSLIIADTNNNRICRATQDKK